MNGLRQAFEIWHFYLTNNAATNAELISKLVAIGTGMVGAGVAALIAWPFLRRIER